MQTILNFWNGFLAIVAEAWHGFVSAPGKFIALIFVMLILGLIMNIVFNALFKSKFMQFKTK
jgi:hypothetical protein